jgi:tetratricopeptide (TPR) repeat protein
MNAQRMIHSRSTVARVLGLVAVVVTLFGATGCSKLKARDLLNKGVASFKNGQYDTSIEDFKQAKDLDPSLLNARLYLATAYATEYIPGAPSDENVRVGQQAVNEFQDVLSVDSKNLSALDGIGSILYNMAGTPFDPDKYNESKKYHQKHIELSPSDPEPYYWLGVIDWTLA